MDPLPKPYDSSGHNRGGGFGIAIGVIPILYVGARGLISELYLEAQRVSAHNNFYPEEKKREDRRSEEKRKGKKRKEGLRIYISTLWVRIFDGERLYSTNYTRSTWDLSFLVATCEGGLAS